MVIKFKPFKIIAYKAMALYPFIFINPDCIDDEKLLNHERIHLEQQKELLVVPFYVLYLLNWLVNLCIYVIPQFAYRQIIFELEAKGNEQDMGYLTTRKRYAFLKYLRKPKRRF
jgi:hypothetical protein